MWRKPEGHGELSAIDADVAAQWPEDQEKIEWINRVFDRLIVSCLRFSFYKALTTDLDLLKRTSELRYDAPLNLIRRSLSTNIIIAVCALHDKASKNFNMAKFIDGMLKRNFDQRALTHHRSMNRGYSPQPDVDKMKLRRSFLDNEDWKKDIQVLSQCRHRLFVHFSKINPDDVHDDIDQILCRTFQFSVETIIIMRRLFIGAQPPGEFEEWLNERAAWQASNLVSMLRPPT